MNTRNRFKGHHTGAVLFLSLASTVFALDNGMALKPPMGWNSWNVFRQNINEENIKAIADQMVSTGLAEAGYEYLVIDGGWYENDNVTQANKDKFPGGIKASQAAIEQHFKGIILGVFRAGQKRLTSSHDL